MTAPERSAQRDALQAVGRAVAESMRRAGEAFVAFEKAWFEAQQRDWRARHDARPAAWHRWGKRCEFCDYDTTRFQR